MSQRTRRQFLGSVGSVAATTVLAPGALAAGRPAPVRGGAAPVPPGPSSSYVSYQSEIYLNGMVRGVRPTITTNLSELEAQASKVLGRRAREHFLAGAGGAEAVRANARAFHGWRIVPRMFLDRADRDLNTTVLGARMPAPVILAPVRRQRLAHPDGELASARAAAALELTYVQSARASLPPSKRSPRPVARDRAGTSSTGPMATTSMSAPSGALAPRAARTSCSRRRGRAGAGSHWGRSAVRGTARSC